MEQKHQILKLRDVELVHLYKIIGEDEQVPLGEYDCKTVEELEKHVSNELLRRKIFHVQ